MSSATITTTFALMPAPAPAKPAPPLSVRLRRAYGSCSDPEAGVPERAVRRVPDARLDAIARAVRVVAEVRPALQDSRGAGACGCAAARRALVAAVVRVGAPLPDVADHVEEAEWVRQKRIDRRPAAEAV